MRSIAAILIGAALLASQPARAEQPPQPPPGNDSLGADWGASRTRRAKAFAKAIMCPWDE